MTEVAKLRLAMMTSNVKPIASDPSNNTGTMVDLMMIRV